MLDTGSSRRYERLHSLYAPRDGPLGGFLGQSLDLGDIEDGIGPQYADRLLLLSLGHAILVDEDDLGAGLALLHARALFEGLLKGHPLVGR